MQWWGKLMERSNDDKKTVGLRVSWNGSGGLNRRD